jgi:hypothetical protein
MKKDRRLEELSDKVRMGEPIDYNDAVEVIEYQEKLREYRKSRPWWKFW